MTGNITNVDRVLLGVLRILSSNREDKPLLGGTSFAVMVEEGG
jgi:hypothetical protein